MQSKPATTKSFSTTKTPLITPPRAKPRSVIVPNEGFDDKIARAKGYPYPRPDSSFVFVNGQAFSFPCSSWRSPEQMKDLRVRRHHNNGQTEEIEHCLADVLKQHGISAESLLPPGTPFTPVLAIGSNASPEQLARKFPSDMFPDGVVIPVIQCVLKDFDVVYAPLISSYGSVTATLEYSQGTAVSVFLTYLTPPLQRRMHETEGAYNLLKLEEMELLEGLNLDYYRSGSDRVQKSSTVYQYNHQHGTLLLPMANPGSEPVALAEIPAVGRRFVALTQVQMQMALRQVLQSGRDGTVQLKTIEICKDGGDWGVAEAGLEGWIAENLDNRDLRRARVAALVGGAQPFQYHKSQVVLAIGNMFSANVN